MNPLPVDPLQLDDCLDPAAPPEYPASRAGWLFVGLVAFAIAAFVTWRALGNG